MDALLFMAVMTIVFELPTAEPQEATISQG